MWSYMFSNRIVNRADINRLDTKTNYIKGAIIDQERGSDAVRMDLCRIMLVVEVLKNRLVSAGLMTEEEFKEDVLNLDLEDGIRDGVKTQKKVPRRTCSQCGKINRHRSHCYYCGQPLAVEEYVPQNKKRCPKCEQINPPRLRKCQYCGAGLKPRRQARTTARR